MSDEFFKTDDAQVGKFIRTGSGIYSEIIAINEATRNDRAVRVATSAIMGERHYIRTYTLFAFRETVVTELEAKNSGSRVSTLADVEASHVSKFGTVAEVALAILESEVSHNHECERVIRFLSDNINHNDHPRTSEYGVFCPKAEEGGLISLVRSLADGKRDRRTTMKPGRAFRHMMPTLDDKSIAALTEEWIEMTSPRDLRLHVSKERSAFEYAYAADRAPFRNPATTFHRKSIATSCMQGVGRHIYDEKDERRFVSVGEAYASGDFTVAYLTDKNDRVAGRVVYSDVEGQPKSAGPVYGACEQSLDMLEQHLESIAAETSVEDWSGLRLLALGPQDDPVVPYLDGDLSCELPDGEYIHLLSSFDGSHTFEGTDGYLTGGIVCECCGNSMTEDDVYHTDDGPHCEHCFDEHFVYTENGEVLYREDAVYAFVKGHFGIREEYIHMDDAAYCELIDEWWHADDVVWSESGDQAIPFNLMDQYPELFETEEEEAA
jgi:hypothetical protein